MSQVEEREELPRMEREMRWEDSILSVKGIGPKRAELFGRLSIQTVGDLLEHLPRDYDQYGDIVPIRDLEEGSVQVVKVTITSAPVLRAAGSLLILSCAAKDDTGTIQLTWFNMPYLRPKIRTGVPLLIRGKVQFKRGSFVLEQGRILTEEEYLERKEVMQPIYGVTKGLTNQAVANAVKEALTAVEPEPDYLLPAQRDAWNLMGYGQALQEVHFPRTKDTLRRARRRLVFDEFYLFSLLLQAMREDSAQKPSQFPVYDTTGVESFISKLPFQLTNAQCQVWEELKKDLRSGFQMHRLIQGDVGSGKTILAVLALLAVIQAGYQGCLMAPTEVLAQQHAVTIGKLLSPLGVRVGLLTGSLKTSEKRQMREAIAAGEIDLIIGTHALIQEEVHYASLALVITDEQHRFGVRHRERLAEKGREPHVLTMSATPIPRTLAILLYGDLDLSLLRERPANRLPIKNCVVDPSYRATAYRFIQNQVNAGHQAYVICPMVQESDRMEGENVVDYGESLQFALGSRIPVGILHGKMRSAEKNQVMEQFAAGTIKVLVSTTVVEVGVDVPNATVMMIENAERFGLAQLHQLRGRVGRGDAQSYCILVSGSGKEEVKDRLEILVRSNDGFEIAEEDLKLRGPGDLFGLRQSGDMEFAIGDIYADADLLKEASDRAKETSPQEREAILSHPRLQRMRHRQEMD